MGGRGGDSMDEARAAGQQCRDTQSGGSSAAIRSPQWHCPQRATAPPLPSAQCPLLHPLPAHSILVTPPDRPNPHLSHTRGFLSKTTPKVTLQTSAPPLGARLYCLSPSFGSSVIQYTYVLDKRPADTAQHRSSSAFCPPEAVRVVQDRATRGISDDNVKEVHRL